MNPIVKKKWVDALNIETRQQGHFFLRKNDCLCVYGILCDLAVKEGACPEVLDGTQGIYKYGKDRKVLILPEEVIKWAGMSEPSLYDKQHRSLSELNDRQGLTFKQLAKIIDEEVN